METDTDLKQDDIESDWLSTIKYRIHLRDLREKIPFENISPSYTYLLDENVNLQKQVTDLSQAVLQLKQDNIGINHHGASCLYWISVA